MRKAVKEIRQTLPAIDVFIEILDARIPFSSQNPMLEKLRADKPCIKVLNKNDLADPAVTESWQHYWDRRRGVKTLALSCGQRDRIKMLTALCRKMAPAAGERLLHALIMGIPNVGKSTLINVLAGKAITKTGNEPAITKRQQRIAIDRNLVLVDTPGLLWPNVENKSSGYRLAATGAIKDTALSYQDIGLYLADFLIRHYTEHLKSRFNLTVFPDTAAQDVLESIGKNRGCLKAGGLVDFEKASKILINELRSGALGKISLETPAIAERELAELAIVRAEKKEKENRSKTAGT